MPVEAFFHDFSPQNSIIETVIVKSAMLLGSQPFSDKRFRRSRQRFSLAPFCVHYLCARISPR
tara:strand:- start:3245 stop:3433 length:189 start_codon:yes stop_codon:yes gene_type:complete